MEWLYETERGDSSSDATSSMVKELTSLLAPPPRNPRKKLLAVLARAKGFSVHSTAEHLDMSRNTVRRYLAAFDTGGIESLLGRKCKMRKADDESFKQALFSLLHEPPSLSGHNRTTWRMDDLQNTLRERGHPASDSVIREAIVKAGFRWRSAKVVLTSNDPDYRQKLEHVQAILSGLGKNERFFSIDEFGPFAIKAKPGRVLAEPGSMPSVPQWQKSKGWLIATAALELSGNQVTHFYSRAKNTAEMIRMTKVLLEEYRTAEKLYLSWDAASWHMSKELLAFVEKHNEHADGAPKLELAPLPASAQFLNVIESVFSGMSRAIIRSSDYPSVDAAMAAIDRYFKERNQTFRENPRRAGRKIWGKERTKGEFDASNNCKDPAYR
jgi:transposase